MNLLEKELNPDYFEEKRTIKRKEKVNKPKRNSEQNQEKLNLTLKEIYPKTDNQKKVFQSYERGQNVLLHGIAGCGKTFLSLYLALKEVLSGKSTIKKVYIVRSAVPSRDSGFLPGSLAEKTKVYEAPYYSICSELFGRDDAYEILKKKGIVEFISTSYLRGTTFKDAIIIMDEIQNMDGGEGHTALTRVGTNCKVLLCGDFRQTDLQKDKDRRALFEMVNIIDRMSIFDHVEFTKEDIVRSGFCKNYILARESLGII